MSATMTTKTPPVKESVGALYICFDTPDKDSGDYTTTYEEEVIKSEVVKSLSRTENGTPVEVYASDKLYKRKLKVTSVNHTVGVVAFDAATLARMRDESISTTTGLGISNDSPERAYFAFGKVILLDDGYVRWEWYPKCQLSENTEDTNTSEGSYAEQDDTLTIVAYPYNDAGDYRTFIDTSIANPKNITEAQFFAKPILTESDLPSA